jgi:putative membrane protein
VRLPAILSILVGLGIVIALIVMNGAAGIAAGLAAAGWGILAVIAMHLPQVVTSSFAWRTLVMSAQTPPRLTFFGLRWIREGVNGLLPVAQIGGHIVGARLLALAGVPLSTAGATVAVDLTMEMLSQAVFTLLGVGLLAAGAGGLSTGTTTSILAAFGVLIIVFILAQRFGFFRLLESGLLQMARRQGWTGLEDVSGLHAAIVALYQSRRRLIRSWSWHFVAWLLGGLEVMVGLHVLGVAVGLRDATIIESLGQAFRAVGFVVPGGLGIQESGVLLICSQLGIAPQVAIELSLLRRIRELALGGPGLLAWYWIERPRLMLFASVKKEPCRKTAS